MTKNLSRTIRIVAADDHRLFLEGLKSLFQLSNEYDLIATCQDGNCLVEQIKQESPEIALIDLSMPGCSTTEIISSIITHKSPTKLIALTMHMEGHLAKELLSAGLSGYILKESAFEELTIAIDTVLKGEIYLSKDMQNILANYDAKYQNEGELTQREKEVLQNAARGQSNKEIARTMDISERTVRFHLGNCCLKLNAKGRSNAIAIALKESFISY